MLAVISVLSMLTGCQTSSLQPYRDHPRFELSTIQGADFRHLVLQATATNPPQQQQVLHVYIEGDGRPWRRRNRVALDPTPATSVVMPLLTLDSHSAIFLGRPCYFGVSDTKCTPLWWTHRRYAPEVVASMNAALDKLVTPGQVLRLIGHSGGGALAMLMAARRADVEAVITLAGNLDVESWARWHEYSPLAGSLNPRDSTLPAKVRQLHYAGSLDEVVPPELGIQVTRHSENVAIRVIEGIDHDCCWEAVWPDLLHEVQASESIIGVRP